MFFGSCAGLVIAATPALAASGAVIGSVQIEQSSPSSETFGTWTLLMPDQSSIKMTTANHTVDITLEGNYTIFMDPPEGMSTKVYLYKGDALVKMLDRPQISFVFVSGDAYRISFTHILSRVGEISVNSNPSGVAFRLEGPNKITINEKTPFSQKSMPEGQYVVQFTPDGCVKPRPQSLLLRKDGRLNFNFDSSCDTLVVDQPVPKENEDGSIGVLMNGETVFFRDVPQSAWFATYVFDAAKTGLITGYKNDKGEPLGRFGPENPVTIGEIAKIAHKVAGIDENDAQGTAENPMAKGEWFAQFVVSAEQQDWLLFQDPTIDLLRPATRGEVLVTFLQALDIPLEWPTGTLFKDVKRRTPFAGAIETAANIGIVAGSTDEAGNETGLFRPVDQINRAEVAKILSVLMDLREAQAAEEN